MQNLKVVILSKSYEAHNLQKTFLSPNSDLRLHSHCQEPLPSARASRMGGSTPCLQLEK